MMITSRRPIGFGVERTNVDSNFARLYLSFSQGIKGIFGSDFDYEKVQFYYRQPLLVGGFGRLFTTLEAGKIFGTVPLGLMGVVPGNQSFFIIDNTYNLMNYYEFMADEYVSLHFEHNFNGRLFARVPFLRKLNWREIIGVKGVYGTISDANRAINAQTAIPYRAPEDHAFGVPKKQLQDRRGIPPQRDVQKTVGLYKKSLGGKVFEALVLVGNP